MTRAIPHTEWQVLRAVLRHKGGSCPGSALRLVPSRRTRGGIHLAALAAAGLIEPAGEPAPATAPDDPADAAPLRTRWRLTPAGRHAAEYGEYDDGTTTLSLPTPEEFAAARRADAPKGRRGKAAG